MKRPALLAATAVLLLLGSAVWLHRPVPLNEVAPTDRYDGHFRKYAKRYFSVLSDWRWFKAQSMAESSLRQDAVSSQGAVGIMQILPGTFSEIVDDYHGPHVIAEPRWNIASGIAFNRHLYERWRRWVPPDQTFKFTLASYNAGLRRIVKTRSAAARKGRDPNRWSQVAPFVPGETRHYVRRIHKLMGYE